MVPGNTSKPIPSTSIEFKRSNNPPARHIYRSIAAREPSDKTETAILEWLRRIHFKARTAFQKPYPGLISRYPEGDLFGYIIVTTIDGMEQALQRKADYALGIVPGMYRGLKSLDRAFVD